MKLVNIISPALLSRDPRNPRLTCAVRSTLMVAIVMSILLSPALATSQSLPTVTLSVKDTPRQQVIDQIATQAGLSVSWSRANVTLKGNVSASFKDTPVNDALATVLKGTGIDAKISEETQTIVLVSAGTASPDSTRQTGILSGRVTDSATGKPIQGATVTLVGTRAVVTTNERGQFTFRDVPVGSQSVSVRSFGYRSVTRAIVVSQGRANSLMVTLPTVPTALAGVVTTATGTQRRLEVGNDITVINVDSVMRIAPISTVTDLLETRVPGLTVMRSSGVPGAPSRIRIRGVGGGMLAGREEGAPTNDPIVVVDGIRIYASQSGLGDQNRATGANYPPSSPIDQIDPYSIERIDVLKGPSASALYGSDAANGVIVITTKKGQAGHTRWAVSGNSGVNYHPGVYAAPQYKGFCKRFFGGSLSTQPYYPCTVLRNTIIDSVVRFQALNEPRLTTFGTGTANNVSGTVSGGSQSVRYSMTASMGRELGLLKAPELYQDMFRQLYDSAMPQWMRRPNLNQRKAANASLTVEPRSGLIVRLTSRVTSEHRRQSSTELQLGRLANSYIDTLNLEPWTVNDYIEKVTSSTLVFDQTVTADWKAWSAFPLQASAGFSRSSRDGTRFTPRGIFTSSTRVGVGAYASETAMTNTMSVGFRGTLFDGHRISVGVGSDLRNEARRSIYVSADSLPQGVTVPNRVDQATPQNRSSSTGGWWVEPRLNLNSRFFVNPGFRFDGNSVSGNRSGIGGGLWSLFPKLNFSWIALDAQGSTPYWGFLSLLRPRLAIGVAGVQPASDWQLRLMKATTKSGTTTTGEFGRVEDGGLELSSLGNTRLHPERTRELDGGFEADLWNGRLTLSVSQYLKMRYDAIERIPVPLSIYGGELEQYVNIGRVRNTGTALQVGAIILENSRVHWAVDASFSKVSNTLVSLNSEQPYIDLGNGTRLVRGYPLFGRWSKPILGYRPPSVLGRWLAKEDVILGDSAIYMGQQDWNVDLPFGTSLSFFRGLVSLNARFRYQDGLTQFGSVGVVDVTNPELTFAEQAAALVACDRGQMNEQLGCTNYGLIQTVNSLRFQEFSISYRVPRSTSQRWLRIPSVSFALQGSNLGLWTSYRGKDPNVNSTTLGDATTDGGRLPQPRLWRLQVNLSN